MTHSRRAFALMTVLWIIVVASVVAVAGSLAARDGVAAASYRVEYERATWRAYDCLERALAVTDEVLRAAQRTDATLEVWRALDSHVKIAPLIRAAQCDVRLEAAGSRVDVNVAGEAQLRRLFRAMHLSDADGLADRLLDWRDIDDVPRPNGAEHDWYLGQGRPTPRNGPLVDVRELASVPGFETMATFDSVLGVESARLCVNHATLTALASVPGFSDEVVARIAIARESGRQILDVASLAAQISRPAADSMAEQAPDIAQLTTVNPEAWIFLATGRKADGSALVLVHARVLLDIGRAVMVSRRSLL